MTEKEHVEGFAPEVGWCGAASTTLHCQPAALGVGGQKGSTLGLAPGVT